MIFTGTTSGVVGNSWDGVKGSVVAGGGVGTLVVATGGAVTVPEGVSDGVVVGFSICGAVDGSGAVTGTGFAAG